MLIPMLVTRPAKANVRPRASTIGNAVGAGRCTTSSDMPLCPCWSSIASLFLSAANDVDNSKNHHPDPIDKVPVEREDLKLSRVLFLDLPREREDQHDQEHGQADNDMAGMQTDQGVERSSKQVGADG